MSRYKYNLICRRHFIILGLVDAMGLTMLRVCVG